MCGVFAWLTKLETSPPDLEQAREALLSLTHRGPDGEGEWVEDGVYLGHQRLRIIDLSKAGDQTFNLEDSTLII